MDSLHKGPVTLKLFPFDDFIMRSLTIKVYVSVLRIGKAMVICIWLITSSSISGFPVAVAAWSLPGFFQNDFSHSHNKV